MNLDDYNIHVIASVFKQWLRDLPNPLMTFELYEEFIRAMGKISPQMTSNVCRHLGDEMKVYSAAVFSDLSRADVFPGLQDKKEMMRGVYSIIDQLSRTHLNTLERLIFHLVR